MDRLLKPKSDPVDRQATFETDSTQAHRSRSGGIKRGTLALPVIGSENSLQTPPIKEGTFESEIGLQSSDTQKNRKQKPEHIHGKNGINVNLNDKNKKGKTDDPSPKKEKSEKSERSGKSDSKQSKINESLPQETKPSSNNNYPKDKKPVTSTKTISLNIDGEKDTESKSSSTSTVNKKFLKNDKRDSKQQDLELDTHKKPEVKINDGSLKNGNSNDSKSSNKRKPELKKQKDEGINVKARDTLSKSQLTRPAKEETNADEIKGKQSNVRNKERLSDASKTDEKPTTEVKGKKSSSEVINNEKQAKQESVKIPSVSEQIKQSTKAKRDQENKSTKSKVYGSGESYKSKVLLKSLAEESEKAENKELDADALSIDLFQFEGENSHLPPTSTALKNSNIQTESSKTKKPRVTSQILETNVKKDSKSDQSIKTDEPTTKFDKQSKEKWKNSEPSSLRKDSVEDKSTKTISDINNSSKNNTSATSNSIGKSSSASPEKYTQSHSSPRITHPERLISPDIHTHTNLHITSAEKEKFPEKRSSSFRSASPDYDNYENFKTSETYRMDPLKSRQPGAERMTESYESVYAERKTLLEAELAYKKRIKQLEDELNQFLRTIDDLRAENKALRLRIDELESNTDSDSQALDSHQSKKTVVIDTEKIGLEARIEDLEKRNKELEQRNTEATAKVKLAASKNESLSKDNEEMKNRIEDLATPKSSTDKLQEESQKTTKSDEENQKPTEDFDKVRLELESTKKENEQLRKENEEHMRHKKADSLEIEKLKQQVVDAKIESKKMEVEMEKYRELATPRNDSAMSPNTEKMELKAQIIGLQTDNQSLNEELIKLKAEHLETLKKLHELEKTANSFQNSVTAVESEKLSEIQTLKNENSKMKTENVALQESLAQKKTEIQELMVVMKDDKFDTEIKELNDDKTKLSNSLEEKDEENNRLKKEIGKLTSKNEELEKEKKICQNNVESLAKLNDTRKTEIADLQQKLKDSISEAEVEKSKSANLAKAEKDIEEANSRASKFEKDLDNERIKNGKETEELKAKHEKDRKQLKEFHDQEIEEWRKKYIQLEKENQEEIRLLKLEIERLKGELEKLNRLKSAVNELEEAKSEILTLQNKYSQVVRDLEERSLVEQRNFELSLKIDALNKKVKQLEKENKEFLVQKDNANDIDSSTKRLTEENKRLREIVDKAHLNTKIEVLERKQKDAETRVKQLEGWVGDLYEEPKEPTTYAGKHRAEKKKKQPFSKAAVPTVTEKTGKRPRSLDEVNIKIEEDKMTHSSTPSLPNIFDRDKNQQLSFGLGYSQIHKRRVNASTKYKK